MKNTQNNELKYLNETKKMVKHGRFITRTLGRGNIDPRRLVESPKRAPIATNQPTKSHPT